MSDDVTNFVSDRTIDKSDRRYEKVMKDTKKSMVKCVIEPKSKDFLTIEVT